MTDSTEDHEMPIGETTTQHTSGENGLGVLTPNHALHRTRRKRRAGERGRYATKYPTVISCRRR